ARLLLQVRAQSAVPPPLYPCCPPPSAETGSRDVVPGKLRSHWEEGRQQPLLHHRYGWCPTVPVRAPRLASSTRRNAAPRVSPPPLQCDRLPSAPHFALRVRAGAPQAPPATAPNAAIARIARHPRW